MSYCVNCGVELDDSAKKCALCDTPVYNPNKQEAPKEQAPFSDVPMVPENMRKKFVGSIISVVIFIPNIVCSLVNIFLSASGSWSVYVNCTSILVWVLFVFPLLTKKIRPILMWAFDTVASAIYVYVFYALQSESVRWYFHMALPIILGVSLCVLVYILWTRKKKHSWTAKITHLFADVCFLSLLVGLLCAYAKSSTGTVVCLIVFLSALALMIFGSYCYKSRRMRAWLSKKLFY